MSSDETGSGTAEAVQISWASVDVTPAEPVQLAGQFHTRISEGVLDAITATALAMEFGAGRQVVLVSCDFICITHSLLADVRRQVTQCLPELTGTDIILNATHSHTAPETRAGGDAAGSMVSAGSGVALPGMSPSDYVTFATTRIAEMVVNAWQGRRPGSLAYGLGQAVIGRNRRLCYAGGESRMYGKTDVPDFRHVEGYEDHDLNLLATWDADDQLTGLLVNVPCPSQVGEAGYEVSADYWHETRIELRRRFGDALHVLPQCSAAGDLSPRPPYHKRAEARMQRLAGRSERAEIAMRIANAVAATLPIIATDKQRLPAFGHRVETCQIALRPLSQADLDPALAEAATWRADYERLLAELDAHPEKRQERRWYVEITRAFRRLNWNLGVASRFEQQASSDRIPVELHAIRLGELAMVTNPTEYYLDFGIIIKARSVATQTLITQLTGPGTYVPSPRAAAGGSYGAVPASTPIGPEGGQEMAEWSLAAIAELYADKG